MPFPPNYNQDRNNRARAKARKALEKQSKRDEKSAQRKQQELSENPPDTASPQPHKDQA